MAYTSIENRRIGNLIPRRRSKIFVRPGGMVPLTEPVASNRFNPNPEDPEPESPFRATWKCSGVLTRDITTPAGYFKHWLDQIPEKFSSSLEFESDTALIEISARRLSETVPLDVATIVYTVTGTITSNYYFGAFNSEPVTYNYQTNLQTTIFTSSSISLVTIIPGINGPIDGPWPSEYINNVTVTIYCNGGPIDNTEAWSGVASLDLSWPLTYFTNLKAFVESGFTIPLESADTIVKRGSIQYSAIAMKNKELITPVGAVSYYSYASGASASVNGGGTNTYTTVSLDHACPPLSAKFPEPVSGSMSITSVCGRTLAPSYVVSAPPVSRGSAVSTALAILPALNNLPGDVSIGRATQRTEWNAIRFTVTCLAYNCPPVFPVTPIVQFQSATGSTSATCSITRNLPIRAFRGSFTPGGVTVTSQIPSGKELKSSLLTFIASSDTNVVATGYTDTYRGYMSGGFPTAVPFFQPSLDDGSIYFGSYVASSSVYYPMDSAIFSAFTYTGDVGGIPPTKIIYTSGLTLDSAYYICEREGADSVFLSPPVFFNARAKAQYTSKLYDPAEINPATGEPWAAPQAPNSDENPVSSGSNKNTSYIDLSAPLSTLGYTKASWNALSPGAQQTVLDGLVINGDITIPLEPVTVRPPGESDQVYTIQANTGDDSTAIRATIENNPDGTVTVRSVVNFIADNKNVILAVVSVALGAPVGAVIQKLVVNEAKSQIVRGAWNLASGSSAQETADAAAAAYAGQQALNAQKYYVDPYGNLLPRSQITIPVQTPPAGSTTLNIVSNRTP